MQYTIQYTVTVHYTAYKKKLTDHYKNEPTKTTTTIFSTKKTVSWVDGWCSPMWVYGFQFYGVHHFGLGPSIMEVIVSRSTAPNLLCMQNPRVGQGIGILLCYACPLFQHYLYIIITTIIYVLYRPARLDRTGSGSWQNSCRGSSPHWLHALRSRYTPGSGSGTPPEIISKFSRSMCCTGFRGSVPQTERYFQTSMK